MNNQNPNDLTVDPEGNPISQGGGTPAEHPLRIGRYRIERVLGKGGFGLVYLAHDDQLNRRVAMKVPHAKLISKPEDAEAYLAEARTVANLDHPGIVPVHDVGSTEDCPCYVVSKYIEGVDLSAKLRQHRLKYREAAELVATVAEALHYAHKQGLVHRDVKPGNILIGKDDKPYVVDFGLALREENVGKGPKYAGTPAYMSPEQARGEGHRVDGRSDIFSLGVVFYELLAGRQPFRGDTLFELQEQITGDEPKPLLQYDEKLPKELQRICFKALSKRAADRYSSAYEMADDLRLFLTEHTVIQGGSTPGGVAAQTQATAPDSTPVSPVTPLSASTGTGSSDNQPIRIVPKGLRAFDAHDADFFLELLPGARDRNGLPDSLRFWKTRIEETDPDNTFSVGLIYGPSGCGKSSLVKAGLLPRLSEDVIAVYIEATPEETETRLLHGLRKRCPGLEDNLSLKDTLAALRRGQGIPVGRKLLIVLDQFEQWMHAKKEDENSELVQALRQCDGGRVQCIVMVRDDFWMAATRFLRELEIRLLEGQNSAAVDLFPTRHAEKVLAAFGRAFGTVSDDIGQTSKVQKDFLKQSVAGLAEEGKVICVRLALFAEMMKGRTWTPATLKEVGGTSGIGVTFLEETFSASTAPPERRYHQTAARAVLRALLPNSGTDIKGEMKSRDELLTASGYASRPKEFDDLIRILDSGIRLITPTNPEGVRFEDFERQDVSPPSTSQRYFQLTHDYLVPSLREWLTRKQKETRRGRAELKLEERSVIWSAKRENKQLPTVGEWLSISVLTNKKRWTDSQRAMMRKSARAHGTMWGGVFLSILLVGTGIQQWASAERWKNLEEQTRVAAESLQNNLGSVVPVNIRELRKLPETLVLPELQTRYTSATNVHHKLSLAFALASYGELDAEYLVSRIDGIAEADTRNYVTALQANPMNAVAALKAAALKCSVKSLWRRKAKLAIAALSLGDADPARDVCGFENRPDPELRTLFIAEFPRWDSDLKAVLEAVKNSDSPALRSGICLGVGQIPVGKVIDADKESWRSLASQWFVDQGDTSTHSAARWLLRHWKLPLPEIPMPHEITTQRDWFVVKTSGATMLRIWPSPAAASTAISDPLEKYRQQLVKLEKAGNSALEQPEIRLERATAYFQVGSLDRALEDLNFLVEIDSSEALSTALQYRTLTLARIGKADDARQSLVRYLEQEVPASFRSYMEIQVPAWLGDIPEASRQLESAASDASADQTTLYNLACAAARCAQATSATDADQSQRFMDRAIELFERAVSQGYQNADNAREDPDFVVLHSDRRFRRVLAEMEGINSGGFWVGDREVTRGQFEQFMNDENYPRSEKPVDWTGVAAITSPTVDHPAQGVSWYDAVMYCNWLSQREGLKPCFSRTGAKEMSNTANGYDAWRLSPRATGYRLLREVEWEYACRAGTSTAFSSGNDESLQALYGQTSSLLTATCGEKLPNAWGLHDVHGNVREWCWDLVDLTQTGGSHRKFRGGGYRHSAVSSHSTLRNFDGPSARLTDLGFRLALSSSYAQSPEAEQDK